MSETEFRETPKLKREEGFFYPDQFTAKDIQWRIIVGARGVGKTIGSLAYYISKCYHDQTEFIYMRRYQNEVDDLSLDVALLSEITGLDVTVDMRRQPSGGRYKCILANDEIVGKILALSVSGKMKSNAFPLVREVIFDEFIDPRGRELRGEFLTFTNLLKTVYRNDTETGWGVLFLANATNINNTYFISLNLIPGPGDKQITDRKKGVKIWIYQTPESFKKKHEGSKLDFIIDDYETRTTGVSSNIQNEFRDTGSAYMVKLNKTAKQFAVLHLKGRLYYYYRMEDEAGRNRLVISAKGNPEGKGNHWSFGGPYTPDYYIQPWWVLRQALDTGVLGFDSVTTRGQWLPALIERFGE